MMSYRAVAIVGLALAQSAAAADTESLFDGRSLKGWKGNTACWSVQERAITGEIAAGTKLARNEFLFLEAPDLRDFILELDYRIRGVPSANSGIQFRSQALPDVGAAGYQADLDDGAVWLGRLYDEHGRGLLVERGATVTCTPAGKRHVQTWAAADAFRSLAISNDWNTYRIVALGPRVELYVNGRLCSALEDHDRSAADAAGRLALQLHSGPGPAKVQFRNVRLTRIVGASVSNVAATTVKAVTDEGVSPAGLNLDFETGTLAGWTATGNAWKGQPVEGDTVAARRSDMQSRHTGRFWLGGYERVQDQPTGTLESAAFKVTQPWASFRIGGGGHPGTRVELVERPSGRVLHTARGKAREDLQRVAVDLSASIGRDIAIRIVDETSVGWGHVNFDDFRFHVSRPDLAEVAEGVAGSPILQHLVANPVSNDAPALLQTMRVPPGFRVDLIATEPALTQPVALAFDERGRIWVAEAHAYPQRRPDGLDRILIFEDADTNGTFETRRVFAEKLNLVSGLEVGFGGIFVGAAPHLLFIPDRNRDDVPDAEPEILLDGWGLQDTHETLNSFCWGPDGWLYGTHGVFTKSRVGRPGTPDGQRVPLTAGVWRYHPVARTFEVFARGMSNPWGLDFNEHGHLFATYCRSAWGRGDTTYVIRDGHYWNQSNNGHAPFISGGPADANPSDRVTLQNFLRASARYGHGTGGSGAAGSDLVFGGHAHVGTMIYLGDNWPAPFRGHLYTHNLFGRQINREVNRPDGSGYDTISAGADVLHVGEPSFMGIDLQYGPDGAVYFIDWCDTQKCHHNAVDKWDRSNGRLYRMAWSPTWTPRAPDLAAKSDRDLIDLLVHSNAWHARTARRLLQERAATNGLSSATRSRLVSATLKPDVTRVRLERIWTAHVTGSLREDELKKLLPDDDPMVRAWAVTLLTDAPATDAAAVRLRATFPDLAKREASAPVRLALASGLARLPAAEVWPLAGALALRGEDAQDRYIPGLLWYGLAPHVASNEARALDLAARSPLPLFADSVVWYVAREPVGREALVAALPSFATNRRARVLELFAYALEGRGLVAPPSGWNETKRLLAQDATPAGRDHLQGLSAAFGDPEALAQLRALLGDRKAPEKQRRAALAFLDKASDAAAAPAFAALLDEPAFRTAAIPLVGRVGDAAGIERLLTLLPGAKTEEQVLIANTLAGRRATAQAWLDAIAAGRVPKTTITALQARQIANLGDAELAKRLGEVWGRVNASSEAGRASAARYRKLFDEAPKWAHKAGDGEAVFAKLCAACHAINGKGGNLGPDLGGAARHGAAYFIDNIVEPNAVIGEAFQLNVLTLQDGTVASGMVTEDAETFTVRVAGGVGRTVRKADVKKREVLEQSMMPPGLLDTLPEKEVVDLLKYLTTDHP